ncbi:hypothetical protein B0H14DRAFT_2358028 [Mycena olivaceomarginata]|nr:hypothetical protein B0H14DRAFT_2358028 [Mycena olivaceomarginata]
MAPGNRRHIPVEQKQLLAIMANHMRPSEIAKATHVDVHTVYRTLETWRTTGKHAPNTSRTVQTTYSYFIRYICVFLHS